MAGQLPAQGLDLGDKKMYKVVIENRKLDTGKILFGGESHKEAKKVYRTVCKILEFMNNVEDFEAILKAPLAGDNLICRGCLIKH